MDDTYDTFESLMMDRINKSLNQDEFSQLETNTWDDLYIKFFMSIYAQICDLPGFSYVRHNQKTIEPITIHVDPKQRRESKPVVLHSVSIPFLKWIFNSKCYKTADNVFRCTFKMPSIFPLVNSITETYTQSNSRILNGFVSKQLILYYVFADHAAYHYHKFMDTGNADYNHLCIMKRTSTIKTNEIKYCHDIITYSANKRIVKYLQPHDTLKVEDQEVNNSYMNIRYGDLFDQSDDESLDSQ